MCLQSSNIKYIHYVIIIELKQVKPVVQDLIHQNQMHGYSKSKHTKLPSSVFVIVLRRVIQLQNFWKKHWQQESK